MEERVQQLSDLVRHVNRAHRKMILQQFGAAFVWSLFVALIIAGIAIAIPKLWVVDIVAGVWLYGWLGGAAVGAFLVAIVWTYCTRHELLAAAIEIDRRYGLKERVSSSLSLTEHDLHGEAGQALLDDTLRRVRRIDVTQEFPVSVDRRALLPLLPALAVCGLLLLDNAARENPADAKEVPQSARKQIKKSTQDLKKKIAERRQEALDADMKDAGDLFHRLEQGLDDMADKDHADRKKALSELNDLANELQKRRDQLGSSNKVKDQLKQLKNLKQGPADKMANAMKDGDFNQALDELNKLKDQLKQGEMDEEQMEELANQLNQMADKMNQIADAHKQAREDLQCQIDEAQKQGDQAKANQLQQQLDQLNQQNQAMQQMQQMANKLGQCAQCMQPGEGGGQQGAQGMQDAAAQLDQLAQDLEQLMQQVDEMQMLEDALDQLGIAKDAMNCDQCGGQGCQQCQGLGRGGQGKNDGPPGVGMGEGQGKGERPEEENPTKSYDSKIGADPQRGKAVIVGEVRGPNVAGDAREEIKSEITASKQSNADPITGKRLPRSEREHAQEYFDSFRDGE